jgi:very-short-patch-repair endonuclease
VVVADMALHVKVVKPAELVGALETYGGAWGVKALRQVVWHSEPLAESPMETRLRMRVVLGGLRRPEAQVRIYDDAGNLVGRPDLYYPQERLGLEYDGGTHRLTLAEDNRRQNRLLDAGVRLLRFTAADIYDSPETVVALVRAQLNRSVHTTNRKPARRSEIVHTTVRA